MLRAHKKKLRGVMVTLAACGIATAIACAGKTQQAGGLEVVISSNMTAPQDYDSLTVVLSQQTAPNTWQKFLDTTRTVPDEITLPTTVSLAAGKAPDQTALVVVTASKGAKALVQRSVRVQLPSDRVAQFDLVLSAVCKNIFCPDGNTCKPESAGCETDSVDAKSLPDFKGSGTNPGPGPGPSGDDGGGVIGNDGGISPDQCPADVEARCKSQGLACVGGTCVGGPPPIDGSTGFCSPGNCNGCCDQGGRACIGVGMQCPSGGTCPAPGATCGGSKDCGQSGQPCCVGGGLPNGGCGDGVSSCVNGTCKPCGQPGQACCGGGQCMQVSGTQQVSCVNNTCVACGGNGQPCCGGGGAGGCHDPSNPDQQLTCGAGDNICHPCGGASQACCDGAFCKGTPQQTLQCQAGTCVIQCGSVGGPCCNGACNGNAMCSGNLCVSCGKPGEACCPYNGCFDQMTGKFGCCIGGTCTGETQACPASVGGGVCSNRQCVKPDGGACGQQQCCMGTTCTAQMSVCGAGGNCQICGFQGQKACPGNFCQPGSNYVADGGCEQCGGLFQKCCTTGSPCTDTAYVCGANNTCGPP